MQMVIDIPEQDYNECKMQVEMIKQEGFLIESLNTALKIHVANGTPLPKGHGRLIDEDTIPGDGSWDFADRLCETPTIIPADESEVEE